MAPDVRKRLLSHPGFITHWDKEGRRNAPLYKRSSAKRIDGQTRKERMVTMALKGNSPMKSYEVARSIGDYPGSMPALLGRMVEKGFIYFDENTRLYYHHKPKVPAPKPKSKSEMLKEKAIELGTFNVSDLRVIAPWAHVKLAHWKKEGLVVRLAPGIWQWIGAES